MADTADQHLAALPASSYVPTETDGSVVHGTALPRESQQPFAAYLLPVRKNDEGRWIRACPRVGPFRPDPESGVTRTAFDFAGCASASRAFVFFLGLETPDRPFTDAFELAQARLQSRAESLRASGEPAVRDERGASDDERPADAAALEREIDKAIDKALGHGTTNLFGPQRPQDTP